MISTVFSAEKCIREKGKYWLIPRGLTVDLRLIYKQQLLFPGIQRARKEHIRHPSKDFSCHPPRLPSLKLQFTLDLSLTHPTHLISYKSFIDKTCISKPCTGAYFYCSYFLPTPKPLLEFSPSWCIYQPTNCSNLLVTGTSDFVFVPYVLFSKKTEFSSYSANRWHCFPHEAHHSLRRTPNSFDGIHSPLRHVRTLLEQSEL